MVTVISPPLPRINAVISIALIGLIQTEERGRGRCRANMDPERDNRFFDTPGASVGCCLRQIRKEKQNRITDFICYLRSVRSYREEITCPSLVT